MVVEDTIQTKESKSGSYTGPLTGNVTGDVTGNLTGSVTAGSGEKIIFTRVAETISGNAISANSGTLISLSTGTLNEITDPTDGQMIIILATGSVTVNDIDNSENIVLNGSSPAAYNMGEGDTLTLIYNSDSSKWMEMARSDNTNP